MEILTLVLLYMLSQNPNFADSVKPLLSKVKDSEKMVNFLKDLTKFTQTFEKAKTHTSKEQPPPKQDEKNPQSPTKGIADEFIQKVLENYLKTH